jgi:hypothetical protein
MQPSPQAIVFISRLLPPMTKGISAFIPGRDSRIAWRNAKDNAEVMELVANIGKILPPAGAQVSLSELVQKCYALGSFAALWAVEGLGHYYADGFYCRNEPLLNLLSAPAVQSLPAKSLTMLHAGIGLSFGQHSLDKINAKTPTQEIRAAVEKFISLCRGSSRPGYTGAAIESLGLVSRWLHDLPTLLAVDKELSIVAPEFVGYLWHGAGRAVYFSPQNFVPGFRTPWRAVAMCRSEPPHEVGRRNMVAGFAWAVTLVNMRFPIIMETVLKYHGDEFAQDDAFSNGIKSSIVMRYDTAPDDPNIKAFQQYIPSSSDAKMLRHWDQLVKQPCEEALQRLHPALKERNCLEEVFHYQDMTALIGSAGKIATSKDS